MAVPITRSVLITGTSTGIGRATALHLAAAGYRVFATVRREEDAANLQAADASITPLMMDLANDADRERVVSEVAKQVGDDGLGGLVNNAAVGTTGPLEFIPLEEIRHTFEVNLTGTIGITQLALPLLRKAHGRIVQIGSAQDRMAPPFFSPYAVTKWGMRAFHECLRLELRPWGIESVLLVPGAIDTPILRDKELPRWDESFARLPAPAQALYGGLSKAMFAVTADLVKNAGPTDLVATAVERALTTKRPKPVALVGKDAKLMLNPLSKLPGRFREWVATKAFKLPDHGAFSD